MQSSQYPYLARLDHLRFFAAALVLLFHWFHRFIPDLRVGSPAVSLIDEGHSGIGLFMVVSGFILTLIARDRAVRYWGFVYNRVVRIYPLFVFAVVLQLLISTYNRHANYGFLQLIAWLVPFRSDTVPLSPEFIQLWTIWVEFQFYLLFPFLLAFVRRNGAGYLLGLLGLMFLVRLLVFAEHGSVRYLAYETIFGRLDQFLVGMLLARLWQSREAGTQLRSLALGWWVAAAGALVAALHFFSIHVGFSNVAHPIWIVWPLAEALLWAAFVWTYLLARSPLPVAWNSPLSRGFSRLGEISFSIYVMHNLVQLALVRLLPPPNVSQPVLETLLWGVAVVLPVTLLVSVCTYYLIEKPFFAYRKPYLM